MSITFDQIISNDTIDRLREAGIAIDENSWFLGDQVSVIYHTLRNIKSQIVAAPGKRFPVEQENAILAWGKTSVLQWVADKAGCSLPTMSRYYNVAKFYPPDLRERYRMLPFSHFEWAMRFPDYAEEILAVGVQLFDKNNGFPMPLRVMQALFWDIDNIPEILNQIDTIGELDDVLSLADYKSGSTAERETIPPLVFHFLQNIDNIARYINSAVVLWDIAQTERDEIVALVRQLAERIRVAQSSSPSHEYVDR